MDAKQQQMIQGLAMLITVANGKVGTKIRTPQGQVVTLTAQAKQNAIAQIKGVSRLANAKVGEVVPNPANPAEQIQVTPEAKQQAQQLLAMLEKIKDWNIKQGTTSQPVQNPQIVAGGEPYVADFVFRM